MIFAESIPELPEYPIGFPGYWVTLIFTETLDKSFVAKALTSNFVRHVEAAYVHYRNAREKALEFVQHDGSTVPLFSFLNSASEFEECIGHMHRAVQCMRGIIRNKAVPQDIRDLFRPKPSFAKPGVANRIRDLRDAVQHTYEKIAKGEIPEDSTYVLAIDGPEVPVPDSDQPGQVLKTFDRLRIGSNYMLIDEIRAALVEMGDCAQRLAEKVK